MIHKSLVVVVVMVVGDLVLGRMVAAVEAVLVRLDDHLRFTVRTPDDHDRLATELEETLR